MCKQTICYQEVISENLFPLKMYVIKLFAPNQYHAAYFITNRKAIVQLSCFLTNVTGIVKQQIDSHIKDPDQQSNVLC